MKVFRFTLFFLFVTLSVQAQNHKCGVGQMDAVMDQLFPNHKQETAEWMEAIEVLSEIPVQQNLSGAVITIPVVVHVIHSGESIGSGRNLSVARINSQLDVLNEDFRRLNPDANQTPGPFLGVAADPEIEFCLAKVDPSGNTTTGITRHQLTNFNSISDIEINVKPGIAWDPTRYLNIYTLDMPEDPQAGGLVLGYAFLPTPQFVGSTNDGLVVHYPAFGRYGSVRGRTATHEIGHYLGLQHMWGENNSNGTPIGCSSDDGVSDTPNSASWYFGCPSGTQTSCGSSDMFNNFMDYVDDVCMNVFSTGQKNVMHAVLNGTAGNLGFASRASLKNNSVAACSGSTAGCIDLLSNEIVMGFEPNENLDGWTTENTNGDTYNNNGNTEPNSWRVGTGDNGGYGPRNGNNFVMYYWNENGTTGADDYLFSPCVTVEQDEYYEVSFWYAAASSGGITYDEKMRFGVSASPNSSNIQWLEDFGVVDNAYPGYKKFTTPLVASADSDLYFVWHCYSDADKYVLQMDDINIKSIHPTNATEINFDAFVRVFPNPASEQITLDLNFEAIQKEVSIEIFDYQGKMVKSAVLNQIQKQQETLELNDLTNGIYFIKVRSGDHFTVEKVIVSK